MLGLSASAAYAAIGPAIEVMHHVFGGEIVAIVPFHAFAQVQHIFGGRVIGAPAFKQPARHAAIAVELCQIIQPAAAEIGVFCPVPQAGVFQRFGFHVHPQCATLLGGCLRGGGQA